MVLLTTETILTNYGQSGVMRHFCKKSIIAPLMSVVLYLPKTLLSAAINSASMILFHEIINLSQVHKKAQH